MELNSVDQRSKVKGQKSGQRSISGQKGKFDVRFRHSST
jgi:hypothetical protein